MNRDGAEGELGKLCPDPDDPKISFSSAFFPFRALRFRRLGLGDGEPEGSPGGP